MRPAPLTLPPPPHAHREVTLVDLLDRLIGEGVAVEGQVILAAADIDLVQLDLRLLLAAVAKVARR